MSTDHPSADFNALLLSLSALDLSDLGQGPEVLAQALHQLAQHTQSPDVLLLSLHEPEQSSLSALEGLSLTRAAAAASPRAFMLARCPLPLLPLLLPGQPPLMLDSLDELGLPQTHTPGGPTLWLPIGQGRWVVGLLGLSHSATAHAPNELHHALRPCLAWLAMALHLRHSPAQQQHLALSRRHADYQELFEAAGVGIARVGIDGQLLDVNQRLADICRRERGDLLGLHVSDLTHPEDRALDQAMVDATLVGRQERYTLEKRYLAPGGVEVWVQLTSVLVRDADGQPLHFVNVVEDISQRRQYQEAILTAQTSDRASKAKTEFLSRMSHELRTPLNAMLGFAQLLRVDPRHPLHEAQRQKVQYIEQAGAHLLAMLTDVLDLSRIEAGSLPLSLEPLRIRSALHEAVALVQHQARDAGLSLFVHEVDDHAFVRADHTRLRQVMVNLLSNAIKYNRPQGQVRLDVQVQAPDVVFSVQDTGQGLSSQQQAHLFEPFNRLGAERSGIEGTGIGLVIVQRLVTLMNGRIEVSSVPGEGSVFRVILPWSPAPQPTRAREGVTEASPRATALPLTRAMRLLYAEDNSVNVELVRQVLRMRPQWQLDVAVSGAEAIHMAQTTPPDLLLLDMHLGDMSGLDVADRLSHHPHTASICKAGLSADAMPDQLRAARERGIATYLTKPLDVSKLLNLLDSFTQPAEVTAADR